MRLSKETVEMLVCPVGQSDRLVFDDEIPGFAVRVTAHGTKVFLFQYRFGRVLRRLRLGKFGEITPSQARRLAATARARYLAGGDPVAERKEAHSAAERAIADRRQKAIEDAFTLERLIEGWEKRRLKVRSAVYRREAPRALRTVLSSFLATPARELDHERLQRVLDALYRKSPTMAKRGRDYARAMGNWAVQRRLLATNPFEDLVVEGREVSRDRFLSDAEIASAWLASERLGFPFGPYFQLLILTLQRRTELAGIRWEELSSNLDSWTVPAKRTKNGKAHVVYLVPEAQRILRDIREDKIKSSRSRASTLTPKIAPLKRPIADHGLIFTTTGETMISGIQKGKYRLDKFMEEARQGSYDIGGVKHKTLSVPWRLHDLRRTGVTTLARLGVAPHVADRLLNHVQGTVHGVAAVYQRHDFMAERKAATVMWGDHVMAVVKAALESQT